MIEDENKNYEQNEKPEVYSIKKRKQDWQISRRDFLIAAGTASAAIAAGMNNRGTNPVFAADDMASLCKTGRAHESEITALTVSPFGGFFATGDTTGTIKLWSQPAAELLGTCVIESGGVLALVFSPDGNTLFWSSDTGFVGDIDRENMIIQNTISVSTGENVLDLAVSPDGNTLAAGDESGTILFYNTSNFSAESETVAHGDAILSLRYSADGSTLYSAGMDASIRKWRVEGMEMIREIISHEATITAFCLLPGEINLLFSDHENQLILYSQADEKELWSVEQPSDTVYSIDVSPDGSLFVTTGTEKKTRIRSARNGEILRELPSITDDKQMIAVTPDGRILVSAAGGSVFLWSLPDGELINCPVDLSAMQENEKGITVEKTDPESGKVVTYTLPCGAEIPDGAVCVCNCVGGSVCSCVGHVTCSCVGHTTCSCVGHTVTYSYHYWHPN